MNPLDTLHLQLRLEGKEVINGNLLRQVEVIPDEEMPLMLIAQLADGQVVVYFDEALQAGLRLELTMQIPGVILPNVDAFSHLLKQRNIPFEIGHYKTYLFPKTYLTFKPETVHRCSKHDPRVKAFGFDGFAEEVYAIEKDGKIVSACVSTRENDVCGEAWVFTDPEHRNQGFAKKVVGAWAHGLISTGKVPFYSHKIENIASANLANRLGLQSVFEEIAFIRNG